MKELILFVIVCAVVGFLVWLQSKIKIGYEGKVTEEFIHKKIDEMWIEFEIAEVDCEDFIRSLVEEIGGNSNVN